MLRMLTALSTVWCWKVCVTNKHSVLSNSEDHTTFPVDHLTDTYVFLQNKVRKTFAPGPKKIMRLEDLMPGHQTVLARKTEGSLSKLIGKAISRSENVCHWWKVM